MIVKLMSVILILCLSVGFFVFFSPDGRGWKRFASLQKIFLTRDGRDTTKQTAATVLYVTILDAPKYNWPLFYVSFPPFFTSSDLTYLTKATVLEQFGTSVTINNPMAIECHRSLDAGHEYLLSLNADGKIIDGYQVKSGQVQLVDHQSTMRGIPLTAPMSPAVAAQHLLGKDVVYIPTRFWP